MGKNMSEQYTVLTEKESFDELFNRMTATDQAQHKKFGNNRAEPVFIDRVLYIYKCMGKDRFNEQRPPEVLAVVRVINMSLTHSEGAMVTLLNETTNQKQVITTQPVKLFGFDVYGCVPTSVGVRHFAITSPTGELNFDTSLVLYLKQANLATFHSYRNIYIQTPGQMQNLYPHQDWAPDRLDM